MALPIYPEFRVGLPGPQIRAAIAAHGADLVHLAGPVMFGASGGTAARKLGLPVVAVYATDMAAYARTYHLGRLGEKVSWALCRRIHNAVDRTLSPSTATAIDLEARGFERVSVWGRGVDTARFDPAKRSDKLRARLAPDGELIVGYVGRVAAGNLDLLAGVAALPGVRLVIIGPARPRRRPGGCCRPLSSWASLRARNCECCTQASTYLCTVAHMRLFGNTLQEAAASGLPVVAPADGGPLDLVEDGVTGFLVTPGDATALADAVAELAADWQLRVAQGIAARRSMLSRTWPSRGDELIAHYEAVLGRTGMPGVAGAAA